MSCYVGDLPVLECAPTNKTCGGTPLQEICFVCGGNKCFAVLATAPIVSLAFDGWVLSFLGDCIQKSLETSCYVGDLPVLECAPKVKTCANTPLQEICFVCVGFDCVAGPGTAPTVFLPFDGWVLSIPAIQTNLGKRVFYLGDSMGLPG